MKRFSTLRILAFVLSVAKVDAYSTMSLYNSSLVLACQSNALAVTMTSDRMTVAMVRLIGFIGWVWGVLWCIVRAIKRTELLSLGDNSSVVAECR